MIGQPRLGHFLGFRDLRQGHLLGQDIADGLRFFVAIGAGNIRPHMRLHVVLVHPWPL